jgi:hypothetical protein
MVRGVAENGNGAVSSEAFDDITEFSFERRCRSYRQRAKLER